MFEISHHSFRNPSQEFHERVRLLEQGLFAGGPIRVALSGFVVTVQVFVRIDFRRVRWKIEDFNPILATDQPSGYPLGMICHRVIEDQELFLAAIGNQSLHETNELEACQCLVTDSGNHREATMFVRRRQDRCLPGRRITTKPVAIFRHRCFVTPVDGGTFSHAPSGNRRVGVVKQLFNFDRILFQHLLHRSSRGVAPAQKIFTHGANRHLDVEQHSNHSHHCPTFPQRKRQPQLLGIIAHDD